MRAWSDEMVSIQCESDHSMRHLHTHAEPCASFTTAHLSEVEVAEVWLRYFEASTTTSKPEVSCMKSAKDESEIITRQRTCGHGIERGV